MLRDFAERVVQEVIMNYELGIMNASHNDFTVSLRLLKPLAGRPNGGK